MTCADAERATSRGFEEGRLSGERCPVPPIAGEVAEAGGFSRRHGSARLRAHGHARTRARWCAFPGASSPAPRAQAISPTAVINTISLSMSNETTT